MTSGRCKGCRIHSLQFGAQGDTGVLDLSSAGHRLIKFKTDPTQFARGQVAIGRYRGQPIAVYGPADGKVMKGQLCPYDAACITHHGLLLRGPGP